VYVRACVCVIVCLLTKNKCPKIDCAERGFSIFSSFHVLSIQHTSLVCLRMFQTPLHFDRTGVRVVAMCPGYTISNILEGEDKFLVEEWKELKTVEFQPYALKHILTNYKPLIQPLRKSYLNIYLLVFRCGKNTS
jgi:hypothetical protein